MRVIFSLPRLVSTAGYQRFHQKHLHPKILTHKAFRTKLVAERFLCYPLALSKFFERHIAQNSARIIVTQ